MDEPPRSSIRIPHPGWWLVCGAVLCVSVLALRIGVPYWRTAQFFSEVERLGGTVTTRPRGPQWLRSLVGDAAMRGFDVVTALNLADTAIDDAWLRRIRRYPELDTLDLNNTNVGDAGMVHLAGMQRLRDLSLFGTRVGDPGLVHLKHLPELRRIAAGYTGVTDAGLVHVGEMKRLDYF